MERERERERGGESWCMNNITIITSHVDKTVSIVWEPRWLNLVRNDANSQ